MNRVTLADRFVSYSDAVGVFPFVQATAFSVALSEPDIRCSIAEIWIQVSVGNFIFAAITTIAVVLFRRSEMKLRAGEELDGMVATYLKRLHVGRLSIIWLAFLYLFFSAYSATLDPLCLT